MTVGLLLGLLAGVASGASVTVRPGETLSDIAARHGTSVGALARANGISDPDRVIAGTSLALGGAVASGGGGGGGAGVTVRPGETLSAIAARHGTTAAALAAANDIADPDLVVAGTRLSVSGAGAAPAAASASAGSGAYTVRPGETLSEIAARAGTSPGALARANGISDPDMVVAGTALRISGAVAASTTWAPSGAGVGDLIGSAAAAHGVDPALARAVAWHESGFSQSARSNVGAIGVMQLMPDTAAWFGPAVLGRPIDPLRLDHNIDAGVAYLGWLQRQSGDRDTAIAAYYQGLTSVRRNGNLPETDRYVANVLANVGRV